MEIIKQPQQLHSDFLKNPQRFLRDFCNISGESDSPFILFKEKIDKAFSVGGDNPFNDATLMFDDGWQPTELDKPRFMHLDLAQNKCGAGLSCCYSPFSVKQEIQVKGDVKDISVPFIKFDFVGRVKAAPGEEIQIDDIEQIIYDLSYRDITFSLITFDRFASLQMKQRLHIKGYTCTEMSIQRTANKVLRCFRDKSHPDGIRKETTNRQYLAGMNSFKEVLYEERMALPFHPILREEIRKARLNVIKNTVEHLPNGTIDIFHSAAGSIFNLINNIGVGEGIGSSDFGEFGDTYYKRHGFERSTKTDFSDGTVEDDWGDDDFYTEDDLYYF